jgi:hypothetical protein
MPHYAQPEKLFVILGFFGGWGFEFRVSHLQSRCSNCLNHTSSPFCSGYFGDGGLKNYLPRLASNHNLPDLSLPSTWDYRCEPPVPKKALFKSSFLKAVVRCL